MTIQWNPLLEGEELDADRVVEIGQKVADELNDLRTNNIVEHGLHRDNFKPEVVTTQWKQKILNGTRLIEATDGGSAGAGFPGNPFTNELTDTKDPAWDGDASSRDRSPSGHQLSFAGTAGMGNGWVEVITLNLDSDVDLKSDDSNALLVLGESHVLDLYSKNGSTLLDTPHNLLFTVLAAEMNYASGGPHWVPLPTTLRFVDGDTNTNNSASSASSWVASGAGSFGSGSDVRAKTVVNKNMPFRSLVTYSDLHSQTYAGEVENSTASDSIKRISRLRIYAALKPCSGIHTNTTTKIYGKIRERVLTAIELNGKVETLTKETAIAYP